MTHCNTWQFYQAYQITVLAIISGTVYFKICLYSLSHTFLGIRYFKYYFHLFKADFNGQKTIIYQRKEYDSLKAFVTVIFIPQVFI